MKTKLPLLTLTSIAATVVAICAAVFSVSGIAKLFAGAALSAGIMAAALEFGKIVSISFLYQFWEKLPKMLKWYLTSASVILMLITSAGIYGYLTAAYAKVSATPIQLNADISITNNRVKSIEADIERKNQRLNQMIVLREQQENRLDNLIQKSQTGNSTTIRNAQNTLNTLEKNVTQIQQEISQLSTSRDSLSAISTTKRVEIETNGDIGTFVYIAKVFNTDLDTVVKWFTVILVLVFDPLAVALVIAINFLLKEKDTPSETEPYEIFLENKNSAIENLPEQPQDEPEVVEEFVPHFNDGQYYTRSGFDWNDIKLWKNNPAAVNYYKNYIEPYRNT